MEGFKKKTTGILGYRNMECEHGKGDRTGENVVKKGEHWLKRKCGYSRVGKWFSRGKNNNEAENKKQQECRVK